MSTPVPTQEMNAAARPAAILSYFPNDPEGERLLRAIAEAELVSFDTLDEEFQEAIVIVCVNPVRLSQNIARARRENVRVIAISNERYEELEMDSIVHAYLPPNTPAAILRRTVDSAVAHVMLWDGFQMLDDRFAGLTREIHELNRIGAALSAEHDTNKLLDLILTKCRELTRADAGSLYLVEQERATEPPAPIDPTHVSTHGPKAAEVPAPDVESASGRKVLRFKLAQNDSVSIPFREVTIPISEKSIAGYVALRGEIVNLRDAYDLPHEVPYAINRKFDEDSGYRTCSILAVPMRDQKEEIVGVIQLINAKNFADARLDSPLAVAHEVIPFTKHQQEIIASLASQAAVAYENSQLYASIQRLFEGFVKASVTAIEARDPTTSGHSFRVANLTVALAETVDRCEDSLFGDITFTRSEMKEIRYASLLHDFGKVGVREEVLIKAKKLYPGQLDLIQQRFEYVKRTVENENLQSRVNYLLEKSRDEYLAKQTEYDGELKQKLEQLDLYYQTIVAANEPTVLPEGSFDSLKGIMRTAFHAYSGDEQPLLREDEVLLLSIRKGSLDESERLQIESHVVHTYNFLSKIPWTKEIRHIPTIARGHHEKLNGLGYPFKLSAPTIPIQTRMMTISDIFDALSASDRPYKKAVSQERALQILGFAVKDGEVDGALLKLFIDGKVFERWKVEPFPY
ncbi:metal dependent phosphohydrolase [Candidatus Koribacter versatilis Ellin345]|uniref:Metal dependent phosphohydrolase n=1 Tax=Koribacter versatilis (strain Ellin345) TaxID=204669 RepID=Q1II68_KORVE|nr:HD family phosphohydrolase [Candidatus Koribacter versatilis]ABF43432.1 metal dependent phosphohydrolase [Candidatus Koribacter versatilis Ellin345]